MHYLYLDDVRTKKAIEARLLRDEIEFPPAEVKLVKSYAAFVNHFKLQGKRPVLVSFDMDLLPEHYDTSGWTKPRSKDGIVCMQWLFDFVKENNLKLPICVIHSANDIKTAEGYRLLVNFMDTYLNWTRLEDLTSGH